MFVKGGDKAQKNQQLSAIFEAKKRAAAIAAVTVITSQSKKQPEPEE
jgi:hypothetical protein